MILEAGDADNLLSRPVPGAENVQLERPCADYVDLSSRFLLGTTRSSTRQYFEIYISRLRVLRPILEKRVLAKWGKNV